MLCNFQHLCKFLFSFLGLFIKSRLLQKCAVTFIPPFLLITVGRLLECVRVWKGEGREGGGGRGEGRGWEGGGGRGGGREGGGKRGGKEGMGWDGGIGSTTISCWGNRVFRFLLC